MGISATGCLSLRQNTKDFFGMGTMVVALKHFGTRGDVEVVREAICLLVYTLPDIPSILITGGDLRSLTSCNTITFIKAHMKIVDLLG